MKKFKVLATTLCMCTMLSAPLTSLAATPITENAIVKEIAGNNLRAYGSYGTRYTVIVDGLRLRTKPGTSATVQGLLYNGDKLMDLGTTPMKKDGYTWINVKVVQSKHDSNGNTNLNKVGWVSTTTVRQ